MEIPFTLEAFLGVFEAYNRVIQPFQVVAYALGIIAVALAFKGGGRSDQILSAILAAFWLWMGVAYHVVYFSAVNQAAYLFGGLYVVQSALFVHAGVLKRSLSFQCSPGPSSVLGAVFVLYAMVIYPVLNSYAGHAYPRMPVFGVAPCPTAIFTFGLLLWSPGRVPAYLLVIPVAWSLIGVSAAVQLGMTEDYGLVVAGVVGGAWVLVRNRRQATPKTLRL